jgi:hypothetical protein
MSPKNSAAVELGRRGGKARAKNMSATERAEAARKAVAARWAKIREVKKAAAELAKIAQSKVPKQRKA